MAKKIRLFGLVFFLAVLIVVGFSARTMAGSSPSLADSRQNAGTDANEPSFLAGPAAPDKATFAADYLLVKFRPEAMPATTSAGVPRTGQESLDRLLAEQRVQSAAQLLPLPPSLRGTRLGQAVEDAGLTRVYRLRLEPGSDVLSAVAALAADPHVEYAEPDYLARAASTVPDDPLFADQWAMDQIQAPAAWDVVTGTPAVVIAVLDTGIDLDHPDLIGRLWANPGETPGNGLDDDGNTYVDDVRGWNFIAATNEVDDDDGHGTQVAGAAVAETDNGAGVAGVCWNCRLMIVKVMQAGGVANYSDVALGVLYAAGKGAEVINLSLGGYADSRMLREAVEAAAGTSVIVAAAGDDQVSTPFYPAAYPDVLAVGGTTDGDARASFSNYGAWVDLAAPAVAITTTLNGGDYGPASGTSLAAPLASGLAGLVWSQHLTWSPALVRAQVLHTASPIADSQLGAGLLNAASAVTEAAHPLLAIASMAVDGDPLGRPAPGQQATLAVTLGNDWLDAAAVTGALTTADPYVTVLTSSASFGSITAGGTASGSPTFAFDVTTAAGYNHAIPFTLHLAANGGAYTATLPLTVSTVSANQSFCGTIASNQTWTSDKTYIVTCNVGIAPGYTLTIQPGTTVKFSDNYSLSVGGTLIADGTQAQPIRFMSNTGSNWGRIYFDDTSLDATTDVTGTYQSGDLLRWVVVEAAGQGIGCNGATPYLSHVTLDGGGVSCTLGSTPLWLQDSDLTGNTTFAAGMSLVGAYDTPGNAWDVAVAGDYAYVADYSSGLQIVDVSDPAHPALVGSFDTPDPVQGVILSGGYAYLADNLSGLQVVDVSDPTQPAWVGSCDTTGHAVGVALSGGYAYVADLASLTVIDVSDPTNPTAAGSCPTRAYANGVAVSGVYAYVADDFAGLTIVNISDPSHPAVLTSYNTPGRAMDVVVSGGYAYVADGEGGLRVIDVSDPAHPAEVGFYVGSAMAYGLTLSGRYAYLGYGDSGLRIVDVSDPTLPTEAGFYDTPGNAHGVAVSGRYAYVADYGSGLGIYRAEPLKAAVVDSAVHSGNLSLPKVSQVVASSVAGRLTVGTDSLVQDTSVSGNITVSGFGTLADNTVQGTISLGSGMAQGNTVTGGGITLSGSGLILTNTLTGGSISAGAGSTVQGNDVENSPGWGISAGSSITVTHNRLVGNANGLNTGGYIQGNLIAHSAGVGLQVAGGTVLSNTLTGNQGSAIVVASGTPAIHGNNLEFNTGTYDLVNNTADAIDAGGNWWGTADGDTIDQRIFDFYDDYTKGLVNYAPLLADSVPDGPAYVRSLTLTPSSPVGIETVTVDLHFSRPMEPANPAVDIYQHRPGTWSAYVPDNSGLPELYIHGISEDPSGGIWFGTPNYGVAFLDNETWTVYDTSNSGLPNNQVIHIAFSPDGTRWFSTWGSGLVHWDGATWTVYDTSNSGLPSNLVGPMVLDADQTWWIGTDEGGAVHYNGAQWTVYNSSNSGLPSNNVRDIAVDGQGRKWFGTWSGLAVLDGTTWTTYTPANSGIPTGWVVDVTLDAEGNVWVATWGGGIARFDGITWTVYTSSNSGLPYNYASRIAIDADGSKWISTNNYVAHFDGTTWTWYNPTNAGLLDPEVGDILIDSNGSKWFGTWGGGVNVWWGGYPVSASANPRWPDPTTFQASADLDGRLPRGLYHVDIQGAIGTDGLEIAPDTSYTLSLDYIGTPDISTPSAPVVHACASASTTTLSAHWTTPPTQAIGLFRYAIGTAPGSSDVTNWLTTTLTAITRDTLNLLPGQTYYVSVQARNTGGIWSAVGSSNPVVAGAGGCPQADFTAVPTSGMSPLAVTFAAQVTGTITSRLWSFGDGLTSTLFAPAHTYWQPGAYTVTLDLFGPGGWTTVAKGAYISVAPDTVPPTGTLTIDGGAAYVPTTTVALETLAGDPSGLDAMRFSNDGLSFSPWLSYSQDSSWTLADGDGPKTVYAQVRDLPGNSATLTDTITLDTTPPTAAVAPLPPFVGTANFTVTWAGTDLYAGLDSFDLQLRTGTADPWTDYLTDTTKTTATFMGTDGQTYYFRVRARDALGNLGSYAPGDGDTHTTLDLLPPLGSVVLNAAAPYANSLSATLTLTATDLSGVQAFQAGSDGASYSPWLSFTTAYSWTLLPGDGTKTVYVRFRDLLGHVSEPVTDTILLHTEPPTGGLSIDGGAWATTSPTVTLLLTATDALGVADMCLANDAGPCLPWEPFVPSRDWLLPPPDGTHTVVAHIRDLAGNVSVLADDILLDTAPPETAATPSGTPGVSGWWRSAVQVALSAFDATSAVERTLYRLDGVGWQQYSVPFTLSTDGSHTAEYASLDLAGNREVTHSLPIFIDTLPPSTTAVLTGTPGGDGWYSSAVQVSLSAADGTSGVAAIAYRLDGGAWQTYQGLFSVVDGDHSLDYYATDLAGNQEGVQNLAIHVDTTPPAAAAGPLTPYQTTLTFPVSWSGSDALTGVASFDVQARDGDGSWTDWLTATSALSSTFAGLDGHTFSFRARARDGLGNLGTYATGGDVSTHVDTTRPEGDISINGGALDTTSRDVTLVLLANGESQMAFSDDGLTYRPWEPFAASRADQLPPGDGLKTIHVRYCCDLAGQIREYGDSITVNTSLAGEEGLTIDDDAPLTEQVTVTLTLKAPAGTRQMMISNSSRFIAAEWEPYATGRTWVLAYYPGVEVYQVYARFRSVDGVVSERYDDIITLHLLEPPPPVDSTPPRGSLVIDTGAEQTSVPDATLDLLAADNPGGVGVRWMYFREWKYDPLAVQWVPVRSSGWLPYADGAAWTLAAGTGVKYVGAWFADGANNVSNPVVLDDINLILPGDVLGQTEVTQYRQSFEAGQAVTVTLAVTSGDADLYIWRPGSTAQPDYWSNLPGTASEQLVFTAVEGEYLIEVHGYASSVYDLDLATSALAIERDRVQAAAATLVGPASLASSKPLPAHPLVTTRPGQAELPDEAIRQYLYLPLVLRGD